MAMLLHPGVCGRLLSSTRHSMLLESHMRVVHCDSAPCQGSMIPSGAADRGLISGLVSLVLGIQSRSQLSPADPNRPDQSPTAEIEGFRSPRSTPV